MPSIDDFKKIHDNCWEIPASHSSVMHVPARVYASQKMLKALLKDRAAEQLINVASLPGIIGAALGMPDMHEGYGFPIGGVAATALPDGAISPGGIGYDINCGVRLLTSNLSYIDIEPFLSQLTTKLYELVPSGIGKGGLYKLEKLELDAILNKGLDWALEHGYATERDIAHCESFGYLPQANAEQVSTLAKARGKDQLGTIGSGNHFVEVDIVQNIFDEKKAAAFGLFPNQVVILIHTGSRGLGHQVATDYIRLMLSKMASYGIQLPDAELACVPFHSPEGTQYFAAMAAAAHFAWVNRQLITHQVRKAWLQTFGASSSLDLLYDVSHNIAKIETHIVDKKAVSVVVHRKGATRAFGPSSPELPSIFNTTGQPVLIPGSMGTASYVLAGDDRSTHETFGSCCHGAGRQLSRAQALKDIDSTSLFGKLLSQGIHIQTGSIKNLAEEAPDAYKDVDEVVNVVQGSGIANKVARLTPCAVIKG